MDQRNGGAGHVAAAPATEGEALEFVRFCHRRKRVGWPELYDEMCAVAGRGLYRGYGPEELAELGIGFGLFEMPALATLVARVVAEDVERRRLVGEPVRTVVVTSRGRHVVVDPSGSAESPTVEAAPAAESRTPPEPAERAAPEHGSIRIAVAAAGA